MKLLLDFLPIILFFVAFKWAEGHPDVAAGWATEHLGFLVQGGVVTPDVAPVLLATLVVMVASGAQVSLLLARGRRVDPMLWVSLALVVVLGAATVWFHSETFIKWKPTVLYWAMGSALLLGLWVWKRNLLQSLLGAQMKLPETVWARLNVAWALFFLSMGGLNLWVAYHFDTATWVNFKLFGGMGLLVAFSVAQAIWVSRHLIEEPEATP
ncbi:MAG: septation protein A [Burkholderiales bacterium]|nr:septation protein A [Burkholderiales bacterium]NBO75659.1 septation protein A [Betaproteobacteria bacterium]